ncbi:MAG: hypothetical protein ACRD1X_22510 [Vicinamibacteria bacterium]
MRLVSINVGGPREVLAEGRIVRTSIFKTSVSGPVRVGKLNLEGDAIEWLPTKKPSISVSDVARLRRPLRPDA